MFKKVVSTLLVLFLVSSIFVGCSSTQDKNSSKEEKVIKIGAYGSHPPYNFTENDKLVGFEVDIFDEIAKRNNLKIEYTVSNDVSGLFGMLESKKIDTILCQVAKTSEREEKYNFSETYMYSPGGWFVRKDATPINKIEDLFGKKVGVVAGGKDIEMYKKADPESKIKQVVYSDHNAAIQDVVNKRIDAVGTAIPQGNYRIKNDPNLNLKVTGNNGDMEINAFPFLKGTNDELITIVNKTIKDLKSEGVLKSLSEKWFGIDVTIEKQ